MRTYFIVYNDILPNLFTGKKKTGGEGGAVVHGEQNAVYFTVQSILCTLNH